MSVQELVHYELFEDAPPSALQGLARHLRRVTAVEGEVLLEEEGPARSFVLLGDGAVRVHRGGRLVAELGPGAVVGELALLRGGPRTATVTATAPTTGLLGDATAFEVLLQVPGAAERLALTARRRLAALVRPVPVQLADGATVLLRPVLPGDLERAAESVAALSPQSLRQRFHGGLSGSVISYLVQLDYVDHFAWAALEDAEGPGLAHGRFVRSAEDPSRAEVAFSVSDALQGRGMGTVLMGALSVAAAESGITTFTSRSLVGNTPALALLAKAGAEAGDWSPDDPEVVLSSFPVPEPEPLLRRSALVVSLREAVRQVVRGTT